MAGEVLDRVRQREATFLERLVLAVLTATGYGGAAGAAEHLGKSGDEGLDGVIRQDPLGLDRIYVQAKRYASEKAVGRPEIQEFVGPCTGPRPIAGSSSPPAGSPPGPSPTQTGWRPGSSCSTAWP